MIASSTALFHICILYCTSYWLFYYTGGFSVPVKEEHKANKRKKEEEYHQI